MPVVPAPLPYPGTSRRNGPRAGRVTLAAADTSNGEVPGTDEPQEAPMTIRTTRLVAAAALVVALAGCGQEKSTTGTAQDGATKTPEPTRTEQSVGTTDELTAAAIEDLAERLGVDPAEVAVVDVEAVTWSNGAIGCAKPGMSYTEALVEGTRITLAAGGTEYAYHSGHGATPTWCASPTE